MALDFFNVTRNTTKYIRNANGLLEQVPANVPALEFNADGTYKGCLIEPANTEKIKFSKAFDNVYWNNLNTTITGGQVDPKGNNEAFLLAETTASFFHLLRVDSGQGRPTISENEPYTQSWFVKKGTGANAPDIIQINFTSTTQFGQTFANFNLATGEFTRVEGGIVYKEQFSNGWWRIGYKITTLASGTSSGQIAFCQNNPTADRLISYTGQTDADVFIYGANLKQSPVMESYTETTGSEVTRNADVITKTDAADLIGQSEGRVIQDVEFASETTLHVMGVDVVVTKGRIEVRYSPTQIQVFLDDVSQGILNGVFDFSGTDEIQLGHYDGASQIQGHTSLYAQYKTAQ